MSSRVLIFFAVPPFIDFRSFTSCAVTHQVVALWCAIFRIFPAGFVDLVFPSLCWSSLSSQRFQYWYQSWSPLSFPLVSTQLLMLLFFRLFAASLVLLLMQLIQCGPSSSLSELSLPSFPHEGLLLTSFAPHDICSLLPPIASVSFFFCRFFGS